MNPAYSVIFFTVVSGAGFGLIVWSALAGSPGSPPPVIALLVGIGLAMAGLGSSFGHLGRPERAWRAFSQWRTSWLSREAVAAFAALATAGALAAGWFGLWSPGGRWLPWMVTVLCIATIWCTAMIYASLRTIPNWNRGWVPWIYLAFGLGSGGAVFMLGELIGGRLVGALGYLVAASLGIGWALKLGYWRAIDGASRMPSVAAALGLPEYNSARLFEGPATRPTYVQREMGYRVARKHAARLRRLSLGTALAAISLLLAATQATASIGLIWCLLAIGALALGLVVERWLFFAEAEHVSRRYY